MSSVISFHCASIISLARFLLTLPQSQLSVLCQLQPQLELDPNSDLATFSSVTRCDSPDLCISKERTNLLLLKEFISASSVSMNGKVLLATKIHISHYLTNILNPQPSLILL